MADDRVTMDEAVGRGVRAYFSNSFYWLSMAWVLLGLYAMLSYRGLISRQLGLPATSAEVYILCFGIAYAPVAVALWIYIRRLNRARVERRERFAAAHDAATLLTYEFDPQRIYRVVSEECAAGTVEVTLVWSANRPVRGSERWTAARTAFRDFDAEAFVAGD